jgi:hypothetical protein
VVRSLLDRLNLIRQGAPRAAACGSTVPASGCVLPAPCGPACPLPRCIAAIQSLRATYSLRVIAPFDSQAARIEFQQVLNAHT